MVLFHVAALFLTTPINEVEPNETRASATPAAILVPAAGGVNATTLVGLSRGAATTGSPDATRDYWQLTLTFAATTPTIYKHSLSLSTTGTQGHTGSIIGHQRTGDIFVGGGSPPVVGVEDPNSLTVLQSTSISTTPPRTNVFYTLGSAPVTMVYRVIGASGTTANYTATLSSEVVTPTDAGCPFAAGVVTLTTEGQGHSTDTELFVFDAATLSPMSGLLSDDVPTETMTVLSEQARVETALAPGRYVIAIGNYDTVGAAPPPEGDASRYLPVIGLTDTPGLLVNSSAAASLPLSFEIKDARTIGTAVARRYAATKPGSFGIIFHTFTVRPEQPCGVTTGAWRIDLAGQGNVACWDGQLDNNDYVLYTNAFVGNQLAAADIGKAPGIDGADGRLDNNDWVVFVNLFFAGCQ